MKPSCAKRTLAVGLVATLFSAAYVADALAQAPATNSNDKAQSGFSVQTPPNPIPVLPMPMGNVGVPQGSPQNPNQPQNQPQSLPPPPMPPSIPGHSQVLAYDPSGEKRPILIVKTSEGEFKIRFNRQWAPHNVDNVMELSLGLKEFTDIRTGKKVKRPFYTGLTCHRVIKGFLIQCGCPFGNGRGGPGFSEKDEVSPYIKVDRPGLIVMAPQIEDSAGARRYVKNSSGSQFFISLAPMPELDGQATIIGEVSSGMDTIKRIASTPTGPTDRPIKKVIIFSIDPDTTSMGDMPGPGSDPFKN